MLDFFRWTEDVDNFRRCEPCGGELLRLFPRLSDNARNHIGHYPLHNIYYVTVIEWIRIKLGSL